MLRSRSVPTASSVAAVRSSRFRRTRWSARAANVGPREARPTLPPCRLVGTPTRATELPATTSPRTNGDRHLLTTVALVPLEVGSSTPGTSRLRAAWAVTSTLRAPPALLATATTLDPAAVRCRPRPNTPTLPTTSKDLPDRPTVDLLLLLHLVRLALTTLRKSLLPTALCHRVELPAVTTRSLNLRLRPTAPLLTRPCTLPMAPYRDHSRLTPQRTPTSTLKDPFPPKARTPTLPDTTKEATDLLPPDRRDPTTTLVSRVATTTANSHLRLRPRRRSRLFLQALHRHSRTLPGTTARLVTLHSSIRLLVRTPGTRGTTEDGSAELRTTPMLRMGASTLVPVMVDRLLVSKLGVMVGIPCLTGMQPSLHSWDLRIKTLDRAPQRVTFPLHQLVPTFRSVPRTRRSKS